MPVLVSLTEAEVDEANRLGDATYEVFKGRPGYYRNLQGSHRKGKYGEVAVEKWAKALGLEVESVFRDISQTRREDLVIGGIRVEVKTWDDGTWDDMGRCVTPGQLGTLRRKADAIIWCSVEGSEVTLHGWSTLDDIEVQPVKMTGPSHYPVANHQVPAEQLRPLDRLLDLTPR
jgi:hypothetical protein